MTKKKQKRLVMLRSCCDIFYDRWNSIRHQQALTWLAGMLLNAF